VRVADEAVLGRVAAVVAVHDPAVLVLGRGSNVLVADGGFAGLGLLLTAAGTIGIDALLRRRARNKNPGAEEDEPEPTPTGRARPAVNGQPAVAKANLPRPRGYIDPRPGPVGDSDATSTIPVARLSPEHGNEQAGELYSLNSSEDIVQIINDAKLGSTSGDETVVLPSPAGRKRRDDRSGGR
jgi:hypothetical protein